MSPKKYLGSLPKYKKTWVKERSTFGFSNSDYAIYLILETDENKKKTITKRLNQYTEVYPCEGIYFFEIFKYLKKIQASFSIPSIQKNDTLNDRKEIIKLVKKHLLKRHSNQLKLNNDKLIFLNEYSELLNECFNVLLQNNFANISLVIQKKLGYKYYENIVYN